MLCCISSCSVQTPGSNVCLYSTFRLMCVSWIVISIGSTWEAELSSRKVERFRKEVMKRSAFKACSWHCRKPLCSASGEWAAASGPVSSRTRTSGSSCLLRGSWSEPEPYTHTHNLNSQESVFNNEENNEIFRFKSYSMGEKTSENTLWQVNVSHLLPIKCMSYK